MSIKDLKANFKFHGVGQGLFYSGCIINRHDEKFNFIYDCGTSSSGFDIENAVINCFNQPAVDKPDIHCLFISHFHLDHISGVPYILKHYNVHNVIIPNLCPEEMALMCINNNIDETSDLYYLITEPIHYFNEYGVDSIFFIDPQDNEIVNNRQNESYGNETRDFFVSGKTEPKRDIIDDYYSKSRINAFKCGSLTLNPYRTEWIFKIYQDYDKDQQKIIISFMETAYEKYSDIPLRDDIKNAVSNQSYINDIKYIYRKIKKDINQSSLTVYHGPAEKVHPKSYSVYPSYRCHKYCTHSCCENICKGYPATLLTGDINLNTLRNQGNDFEKFIANTPNKIGFFQIPHHGSKYNTNISLIQTLLPPNIEMFCSYGISNRYHHPNAYMLNKLMMNTYSNIHHIVQFCSVEYSIIF